MAETWVINEIPTLTTLYNVQISFVSDNNDFHSITLEESPPPPFTGENRIVYDSTTVYSDVLHRGWLDQSYRTVTFETSPTGDLLTWLQANAVKQVTGYSITYHANGGLPVPEDSTGQTNLPSPLPTIAKEEYTFDGWYTNSTFTTPAVAGAEISADTDLYAKFVPLEHFKYNRLTKTDDFKTVGGQSILGTGDIPVGGDLPYMELVNDGESQPYYYVRSLATGTYIVKGGTVQLYGNASFTGTPLSVPEGMLVYVKYEEGTFTVTSLIYDTLYVFDDFTSTWKGYALPQEHKITAVTVGTDTIDITIS